MFAVSNMNDVYGRMRFIYKLTMTSIISEKLTKVELRIRGDKLFSSASASSKLTTLWPKIEKNRKTEQYLNLPLLTSLPDYLPVLLAPCGWSMASIDHQEEEAEARQD